MERNLFQTLRARDKPVLPYDLRGSTFAQVVEECNPPTSVRKCFDALPVDFLQLVKSDATTPPPLRVVGIVLCGDPSPAAGTHNVILGLRQHLAPTTKVIGFLDGPKGLMVGKEDNYVDLICGTYVDDFLNQGGADMLGYGKFRPLSDRDVVKIRATCERYQIDGLCFVGGPYELTQVANLAQRCSEVTICGVLQSPNCNVHLEKYIPITLGFDSARGVLLEMAGNLCLETMNGSGEVQFIGCGSGSVTLEVALQIAPNVVLMNSEVRRSQKTLTSIVQNIADTIHARQKQGKRSAVVLIQSDGFFESLVHMDALKQDISILRQTHAAQLGTDADAEALLTGESRSVNSLRNCRRPRGDR